MASSSFSQQPSFQNQRVGDTNTITPEEFFAFHNIDRQLFSMLVFNIRREPMEAMHAMAFWLWLERLNMAQIIVNILKLPDNMLRAIVEETLLCLKVVESETLVQTNDVPMLRTIVGKDTVGLRFFHDNRVSILRGVGYFIENICLRAFRDLMQIALASKPTVVNQHHEHRSDPIALGVLHGTPNVGVIGGRIGGFRVAPPLSKPSNNDDKLKDGTRMMGDLANHPSLRVGDFSVPLKSDHFNVPIHNSYQGGEASSSNYGPMLLVNSVTNNTNYALETQPQVIQGDLVDQLLAQLQVKELSRIQRFDETPIPSDERTVFLTFSKGYPILEHELREFFNRTFGDIIEALYMQEVAENEQPLYARLVVRDASTMEIVLTDQGKSKFSINGKHVWARKYVRRNPHTPPSSPTK